jgi:ABC-type Zn uptake system ZnuABC Zn-binding protein ZnuA
MKNKIGPLILLTSISIILAPPGPAFSEESPTNRAALKKELEQLDQSLKPLRQKAYREDNVIAARKKVDEAFREYYRVLRKTMAELDPERAKDIQRLIQIREQLYGKHSGSRAEDYEHPKPESRD